MLLAHPAVVQAAAFGIENSVMGEMVHAAVTLSPGSQVSILLDTFTSDGQMHLKVADWPMTLDLSSKLDCGWQVSRPCCKCPHVIHGCGYVPPPDF